MTEHDRSRGKSFDLGKLDIILRQLIDHVTAHPQRIARNRSQRKADHRHNARTQCLPRRIHAWQAKDLHAQHQHQRIRHKARYGVDKNRIDCTGVVERAIFVLCLQNTHRNAQQQRNNQCNTAHFHGNTELSADDCQHWNACLYPAGDPKVSVQEQIFKKMKELLKWVVQQACR